MKAIILAAGKGSRIHHISNGSPKSLLPLGDTTLLGHSLQILKQEGVDDIIVVTGYKRREIEQYVDKIWAGKVQFVFNPMFENTNVLFSFWLGAQKLNGEDFIFLHADTVFSGEIFNRLMQAPLKDAVFAVDYHPCEEEEMKVIIKDNLIHLITKQMPSADADGEFLGLAKLSGSKINMLCKKAEDLFEQGKFQSFFEHAIQDAITDGDIKVESCNVSGLPWREVDFEEDYLAACELFRH